MPLDVHVVSHTHWDREWYHPFERFRQRLVRLVDELLADPPGNRESFLLDGQAIVLDDYLAIRPERAGDLKSLLESGKLEAGPWYVLADELIPSGEALVRNLLAGRRVLNRFGATPPPVLYCPDSFGHPATLPSIAAGFGFPIVILWRGYGSARWPKGDTARWIAPSGEEVLLFHLPRDGYEFGSHLPASDDAARDRWTTMRGELVPRSAVGVMLVTDGADHHARPLSHRDALDALERAGASDGVHRSSLRRFSEALTERARAQGLPPVRGELRDSYGYTWTIQGTFATRAHEKRLNAGAERLLLRDTEPWAVLAALRGAKFRPFVNEAWRTLLTAHPHDTLCGCSIDDVAVAMKLRIRSAVLQAEGIREDALLALIGHDPASAREQRDRWVPVVLLRNRAPRPRSGVAVVDLEEFIADVPVGPGSAGAPEVTLLAERGPTTFRGGPLQVLSQAFVNSRTESPRHYPDNDLVSVTRVAAWVDSAPAYGIVGHALERGIGDRAPRPVSATASSLSNGILSVSIDANGTVSLAAGDRRVPSLLEVMDEADVGDLYTPAPRERPFTVEFGGARCIHVGPLRGEVELDYRVLAGTPDNKALVATLAVRLTLDAGGAFLRVAVQGENLGENHRVRLVVHGDVNDGTIWADAAFGAVRRERLSISEAEASIEHATPTAPMHRYVSRFDVNRGVTLFSDGLAEYEALSGDAFAVTLVRAVGELSRNDLPERPGHAGWPVPTPGAQCLGAFDGRFAVMLHGPRLPATIDEIERTADDVLLPLVGTTLRSALVVPEAVIGPELIGAGLACSAIKESEDGDWIALRCVNLLDEPVAGAWRMPFTPRAARSARLDETSISEIVYQNDSIAFTAPPRGIVTILVR